MRAIHSFCSLGKERQEQKREKANSQPCLFLLLFLSKSNALPFSLFSSLTRFFFLSLSYLFSFSFSASIFSPSLFSTIFLFFTLSHSFSLLSLYIQLFFSPSHNSTLFLSLSVFNSFSLPPCIQLFFSPSLYPTLVLFLSMLDCFSLPFNAINYLSLLAFSDSFSLLSLYIRLFFSPSLSLTFHPLSAASWCVCVCGDIYIFCEQPGDPPLSMNI